MKQSLSTSINKCQQLSIEDTKEISKLEVAVPKIQNPQTAQSGLNTLERFRSHQHYVERRKQYLQQKYQQIHKYTSHRISNRKSTKIFKPTTSKSASTPIQLRSAQYTEVTATQDEPTTSPRD